MLLSDMFTSLDGYIAAAGLIDRLLVLLVPVALGSGVRQFADPSTDLRLRLSDSQHFDGGVLLLDYQVLPAEP
jgi:hypothetical protein